MNAILLTHDRQYSNARHCAAESTISEYSARKKPSILRNWRSIDLVPIIISLYCIEILLAVNTTSARMATFRTQERRTSKATIRIIEPNILENIIHDNMTIDTNDLLEIKEINKSFTGGKPYVVLVHSGISSSITKEGRELSASEVFRQQTKAKAILIQSLSQRLLSKVYIRINKPRTATKIFSDREEAIEWLRLQL